MKEKVFCIGFQKTGTSSLAKALQVVGLRVCQRMVMLQEHLTKKNIPQQLKSGKLNEIFEATKQFNAFCDNPWPILFKELDKVFQIVSIF